MADGASGGRGGGLGGAGQVAGLDVVVNAPGVTQTKADVVGSLSEMSAAAKSNADAMDANSAAYQSWREQMAAAQQSQAAMAASMASLGEALEGQASAVNDAYAAWSRGEASLDDERLLRRMGVIQQTTADLYAQADAERAATEAQVAQLSAGAAQANLYNDSRAIVLQHMQALEMDTEMAQANAAANGEAAAASGLHNLQLGRLNASMGVLDGRLLGINTSVGRFGALLGGALTGYGEMVLILGAIAGTIWVFDKLSGSTDEAAKVQERLTKAAEDWYAVEQRGINGDRLQQLDAEITKVQALAQQYEHLKDVSPDNLGSGDPGALAFASAAQSRAQAINAQLGTSNATIVALENDTNQKIDKAINDRATKYVDDLANLVKSNHATADEQATAVKLFNDFENQLNGVARTASPEMRNQLEQWAQTLKAAFSDSPELKAGRDTFAAFEAQWQRMINTSAALAKPIKDLVPDFEATYHATNDMAVASENEARLAATSGVAHELLAARIKAENEQRAANRKYQNDPGALATMTAQIQSSYDQEKATILNTQATKDAKDASDFLAASIAKGTATGEANAKTVAEQDAATTKWAEDNQRLADSIQKDLLHAIDQFAQQGGNSWHAFFQDAIQLTEQFTSQFDAAIQRQQQDLAAANKAGDANLAQSITARIQELQKFATAAQGVSTFLSAGLSGYNIGESSGNATVGALGGAASGAAAGAAFGPWGAAAGALIGAAGGLLGAAKAHKEAAEAEKLAAEQVYASLQKMNVQAGTGTQLDVNLADAKSSADQLFDAINKALPGLKNQTEREKELNQVRTDEALITQKLIEADKEARAQFDDDTQARILAAQGNVAGAAALRQQAQDQKELTDAINQFGKDSAQVAEILAAQAAEAAQRARDAAEASQTIDDDLKIRQLYAQGLKDEGDALSRQEQERQELDQAIKDGWNEDQIAALQLTQAMEDQAAAQKKAADEAERFTKNVNDLTAQFLSLTGNQNAADLASLAEQQREAVTSATQAGATPAELSMLHVVQMLQTSQLEAKQAIQQQTDAINAQLKTAQDALSVAQNQLQTLQQAAQSLASFRDGLATGSLSALSPLDQLSAAKAQVEALYQAAAGGDASAANRFGGAAQTYLQLAKTDFASTTQYADIFHSVSAMTDTLSTQYGAQASLQQQTVDALNAQITLLQNQLATLQDANTLAQATKDGVIAQLKQEQDASLAVTGPLIDQFAALRDTLFGVGHDITAAEHDTLLGDQNALQQTTAQEIAAINSGASLQQIAQYDQVRQLEIQQSAQDAYYAQQLAETAKIYGWDSPQVQSIVALQTKYDAGVQQQIDALHGVGDQITGAIVALPGHETPVPGGEHIPTLPGDTGGTNPPQSPGALPTYPSNPGGLGVGGGAFASGGDFSGGLRLVGERGPELEVTGASRITSTETLLKAIGSSVVGNADALAELKALKTVMTGLRADAQKTGQATDARLARLEKSFAAVATQGVFSARNGTTG